MNAQENMLEQRVTLVLKDMTLIEALDTLQGLGKIRFAYSRNFIPSRSYNLPFRNKKLSYILEYLLTDTNLDYSIKKNHIVLFPVEEISQRSFTLLHHP